MDLVQINIAETGSAGNAGPVIGIQSTPLGEPNADGLYPLQIKVACNTRGEFTRRNVVDAVKLGLPEVTPISIVPGSHAMLVGGGPSVTGDIEEIRRGHNMGVHIFALNGAAKMLNKHGITPEHQVIIDPRPLNTALIGNAFQYLVASQCDPKMFKRLKNRRIILFHSVGSALQLVSGTCIGGSITVGLSALCLAHTLGYETLHLYGYDSSYAGEKHHAYKQKQSEQESRTLNVTVYDHDGTRHEFLTNFAMAKQAELFPEMAKLILDHGGHIMVHGSGLLPMIARTMVAPVPATAQAAE